ncbi:MAG: hypothetical protein HY822_18760 [Acidobacteria bacterium]|nr:hypothetical protein [Acidobacteriota bacterium]
MWVAGIIALVLIALAIYEYRLRKPDQLVLYEAGGAIRLRTGAFYPRHFSLALPGTTHQIEMNIDGVARGSIRIRTALVVSVAPCREQLASLVRIGGWKGNAVVKAAGEFETVIQGLVREFSERHLIEELSSEKLGEHLAAGAREGAPKFGLDVVALAVQAIDAADPAIAEAMRQRESARILEQTELLNQQARVAAARAKLEADESIALSEHQLELKRYELKKAELEQEAQLAEKRTEDELKRSRLRLAFEKEEMALLKSSPELLLLSPQAARLAEASQNLKNARTVISLGPQETEQGLGLPGIFRRFLDLVLESERKQS